MEQPFLVPSSGKSSVVDERDEGCPDDWVRRRPEMLRLTGLHPFNSEPPVPLLMESFITPTALHYVRNHGPVPRLSWANHRVKLQDNSGISVHSLSMDELAEMPTRSLPVTLSCAGNRRKEQNIVEKGMGFSWGCGAVSTSVWTGVLLSDILVRFGLVKPDQVTRPDQSRRFARPLSPPFGARDERCPTHPVVYPACLLVLSASRAAGVLRWRGQAPEGGLRNVDPDERRDGPRARGHRRI